MTLPAPPTEYDIGDEPVLTGTFTDRVTGALADPTAVTVKLRSPAGVTSTYTAVSTPAVTHTSLGTYQLVGPILTLAGDWYYRFEGTGALVDAGEQRFVVKASVFTAAVAPTGRQWISGASLLGDKRLDEVELPRDVTLDSCAEAATDYLYRRSGSRYKVRSVVLRPHRTTAACGLPGHSWGSVAFYTFNPWSINGDRGILVLPGPATVTEVTMDGTLLDSAAWDTYNEGDSVILVRNDLGLGVGWPCCQDLSQPLTAVGSWSVAVLSGHLPPMQGLLACRELSIHYALSFSQKRSRIPPGTQQVGRNGQTAGFQRGLMRGGTGRGIIAGRHTGIAIVDDFCEAENPGDLMRRGSVSSPDTIRRSSTPGG